MLTAPTAAAAAVTATVAAPFIGSAGGRAVTRTPPPPTAAAGDHATAAGFRTPQHLPSQYAAVAPADAAVCSPLSPAGEATAGAEREAGGGRQLSPWMLDRARKLGFAWQSSSGARGSTTATQTARRLMLVPSPARGGICAAGDSSDDGEGCFVLC
jgi:hypothetical protein